LNKSQARALGKLAKDESEEAQEVLGTGRITVRDGLEFVEVPIEEASAREIEKATRVKQWQNRREKFDSMDPEPLSINEPDKYRIVYADPPWFYSQVIEKYGPAERHYPTMTQEELCALGDDIKEIITSDAVLFLWSTAPKLKDAFEVAESWGFRYTGAQFIWDKVKHNYGHYNSVRHEILLICVKGSCTPDSDKLIDSVQTIERSRKHSEKPEQFRDIIDAMYPNGKRIELFARQIPQNTQRIWDIWGNEISD
jgi:N6-adenosine-specific RNA methylase IME4